MQNFLNRRQVLTANILMAITAFARASATHAATILPGSTFDLSIIGENATGSLPANQATFNPSYDTFLVPTSTYNFGNTTTVSGITVSSSETVVGTVITDTVTISEPASFDPPGTTFPAVGGSPIETLVFDLGEDAEGGTQNGLNYNSAINPAYLLTSGTVTHGSTTIPIDTGVDFNGGYTSMYETEGVYFSPTLGDLGPYDFNSFTFTATQVPEPATGGILAVAALGLLRRRRTI